MLSPALAARLKVDPSGLTPEKYLAALPRAAQGTLRDTIDLVRADARPRAVTHRLAIGDELDVAHHLRIDPQSGALQGMIELPADTAATNLPRLKDALTGLGTLAAARQWLARNASHEHIMMLIGLTRFGMINSAFGRLTGDAVLRALARRIERLVSAFVETDCIVARVSGTSILVAGSMTEERQTLMMAELTAAIERPVIAEDHEVSVGCSIGRVDSREGEAPQDALRRLNATLGVARDLGDAAVSGSSATSLVGADDNVLAVDLRGALDRKEIDILFQPQVAISTGAVVGVEALARWRHPIHGTLGAITLFAVAARSNYLSVLSAHVQRRAVEAAASWPETLRALRLSVNVTAHDIARVGFAKTFLRMLDDAGFPRARVTVEITEDGLIADLARAADLLVELRDGGCRVAIDDFGTGYSSLAYLKALPLDYLKIDKSIAQDIVGTVRDRIVVSSIIDMARSLGLAVIAEGVETEEQRAALAAQGCNYYQGFLCAEAPDVPALEKIMVSHYSAS